MKHAVLLGIAGLAVASCVTRPVIADLEHDKVVVAALALEFAAAPVQAGDYPWPVVRVIDGDTVAVDASGDMPSDLAALKVRSRGVDTPEKGDWAQYDSEQEAEQAMPHRDRENGVQIAQHGYWSNCVGLLPNGNEVPIVEAKTVEQCEEYGKECLRHTGYQNWVMLQFHSRAVLQTSKTITTCDLSNYIFRKFFPPK